MDHAVAGIDIAQGPTTLKNVKLARTTEHEITTEIASEEPQ
jgi:hypothetical protein